MAKKKGEVVSIKTKQAEGTEKKTKRRPRTYKFPDHGKFMQVLATFNTKNKNGTVSTKGSMADLSKALHMEFKGVKGQPLSGKREPNAAEIRKGFAALKRAFKKARGTSLIMVLPPETDWDKFSEWGE